MTTNEAAKKLCRRTCLDCCCRDHHWGIYDDCEVMCKHCPAKLSWDEICVVCKHTLAEHDASEDWSFQFCDGAFQCKEFRFEGQVVRTCTNVHPWDKKEEQEPCVKCKQLPGICTCTGGPLYDEGPDFER